jgi:hypothetical protein
MASGASIDELLLNLLQGTVGNYVLHFGQQKKSRTVQKIGILAYVLGRLIWTSSKKSGAVLSDKGED